MTKKRNPEPVQSARHKELHRQKYAADPDAAPMPYACDELGKELGKGIGSTKGRNKIYAKLRKLLPEVDRLAMQRAWGEAMWEATQPFIAKLPPEPVPAPLPVPPPGSIPALPPLTAEQAAFIIRVAHDLLGGGVVSGCRPGTDPPAPDLSRQV